MINSKIEMTAWSDSVMDINMGLYIGWPIKTVHFWDTIFCSNYSLTEWL